MKNPKENSFTVNQIARLTGIAPRTLQKCLDSVKPTRTAGRVRYYAPGDALKACRGASATSPTRSALTDVRLAREREKFRVEKIAADLAEGLVVPKEDGRRIVTRFVNGLKFSMLGLPKQLALVLSIESDPVKVEQAIAAAIREAWQANANGFAFGVLPCPHCGKAGL